MYRWFNFRKFAENLRQTRLVNISGGMGTGKTLFAVAVGYEMLKRGYVNSVTSNFPVEFAAAPDAEKCFAIFDEASVVFDGRTSFKKTDLNDMSRDATVALRKKGSYMATPSFIEVDKRFRNGMRLWRTWSSKNRLWLYRWEIGPEEKEEQRKGQNYWDGWLALLNPAHFFGCYDTIYFPGRNLSMAWLERLLLPVEQDVPEHIRGVVPGV
jgi:hypothetical protein